MSAGLPSVCVRHHLDPHCRLPLPAAHHCSHPHPHLPPAQGACPASALKSFQLFGMFFRLCCASLHGPIPSLPATWGLRVQDARDMLLVPTVLAKICMHAGPLHAISCWAGSVFHMVQLIMKRTNVQQASAQLKIDKEMSCRCFRPTRCVSWT